MLSEASTERFTQQDRVRYLIHIFRPGVGVSGDGTVWFWFRGALLAVDHPLFVTTVSDDIADCMVYDRMARLAGISAFGNNNVMVYETEVEARRSLFAQLMGCQRDAFTQVRDFDIPLYQGGDLRYQVVE